MPEIPAGATIPDDHKKSAAQLEAEGGQTITVPWRDHSFEVLADPEDWDASTTLAFEEGKAVSGVRGMLGTRQFRELMKSKPKNRDISDLFATLAKAAGLDTAGE